MAYCYLNKEISESIDLRLALALSLHPHKEEKSR